MAIGTDPFGSNVFGGLGSLAKQVPGATSLAQPTAAAAAKPAPYKYAGQGWNDPLAQQMYLKYAFGGRPGAISSDTVSRLAHMGDVSGSGTGGVAYHNPMDPKEWGGSVRGADVDAMKAAYLAAGGQGTYDQLAATSPKSVGWPTDASGNPLPRAGGSGPEYPQAAGGWSTTMTSGGLPAGGSGSSFSLSPEVLRKMWR